MGLVQRTRQLDPLAFEVLDRVYEWSWGWFEAQEPIRSTADDPERQKKLRRLVLAFAGNNHIDYDGLCQLMLEHLALAGLPVEGRSVPHPRAPRLRMMFEKRAPPRNLFAPASPSEKESEMARRYSKSASKDVKSAMHKRKRGSLKSGRSGKKVTSRKQAIAIGLSEARKKGKKVPKKKAS